MIHFLHPTVKNCTDPILEIDADVTPEKAKETHRDEEANDTDGAKTDPFDKRAYSCKSNIELTTCAHLEVVMTEEVDEPGRKTTEAAHSPVCRFPRHDIKNRWRPLTGSSCSPSQTKEG